MKPGQFSTLTPTNCLRLMQWSANGISGKTTDLLTFLHSNNVNIHAIHETKQTYETKLLIAPGWAVVRHDRHKNKGGGLLMPIRDKTLFVNNTAALPQSADPHQEHQGISITMPNRQQLHFHNIYISPCSCCSDGHNASIAHILSNNGMPFIVGVINAHHS